jgi:hypothetical protein
MAARERQRLSPGRPPGKRSENVTDLIDQPVRASTFHPQVADEVARALGTSRPTYQRAKAVVAAAEEDPVTYGDLSGCVY